MHPTPKSRLRPLPLRSLPLRFVLGGIAAWALAAVSSAQTPSRIIVSKLTTYQQSSAAVVASNGALFTLQVTFPATVPATTLVQLKLAGRVVLTLNRDSTTIYSFTSATGSEGSLDAAIPDGNYTLVVVGNGADTSTAIRVISLRRFHRHASPISMSYRPWPRAVSASRGRPLPAAPAATILRFGSAAVYPSSTAARRSASPGR